MLAAVATACNVAALEVDSQPQLQAQPQTQPQRQFRSSILAKASEILILSAKRVLSRRHGDTPGSGGGGGGSGGATTPSGAGGASANCNLGLPAAETPAGDGEGDSREGGDSNEDLGDGSGGDGGGSGGGGGGDGDEEAASDAVATVRRHHAIYEIVDSEESYVNKLRFIAEKYIPLKDDAEAGLPPDLAEKWSIVWGNWRRLLEGHEEILAKLKQAFQADIDSVAGVFIAKERHMTSWYSKYCENHRKAQHIACEQHRDFFEQVRLNLRDKEDMNSHLMCPVQRCMRYSLLVGTVIDKARKDGLEGRVLSDWERMRDIMRELPMKTESIMEASRIDNLDPGIRITALGQMRTKGVVRLSVVPGSYNPSTNPPPSQLKFEQRKIFLFDQMMLVTEMKRSGKAKTGSDQFSGLQTIYIYRSKVKMNNMRHYSAYKFSDGSGESSGHLFCVADTTPSANVVYVFDPVDAETRAQWVAELRQMEQQQQDFLKVLQNPVMASGGAGDQASGGGGAGASGPGGSGGIDSGRKNVKEKEKGKSEGKSFSTSSMRLPSKWGGRLSFITRSRKSHRSETAGPGVAAAAGASAAAPGRPLERKNSCPDVQDASSGGGDKPGGANASGAAASCSSSGHYHRSSAGKELRKIPSEVGSTGSYGNDPEQQAAGHQQGGGGNIAKKKSGISFNSLQSFFSNRKSKSRSESKLNPA